MLKPKIVPEQKKATGPTFLNPIKRDIHERRLYSLKRFFPFYIRQSENKKFFNRLKQTDLSSPQADHLFKELINSLRGLAAVEGLNISADLGETRGIHPGTIIATLEEIWALGDYRDLNEIKIKLEIKSDDHWREHLKTLRQTKLIRSFHSGRYQLSSYYSEQFNILYLNAINNKINFDKPKESAPFSFLESTQRDLLERRLYFFKRYFFNELLPEEQGIIYKKLQKVNFSDPKSKNILKSLVKALRKFSIEKSKKLSGTKKREFLSEANNVIEFFKLVFSVKENIDLSQIRKKLGIVNDLAWKNYLLGLRKVKALRYFNANKFKEISKIFETYSEPE